MKLELVKFYMEGMNVYGLHVDVSNKTIEVVFGEYIFTARLK